MSASLTSEPESDFVCDCEVWMREACAGEPFYRELEGKRYCVLHFPGKEKRADFEQALLRKLENKNCDYRGVWFPDKLEFENVDFTALSAEVDFSYATFSEAADFSNTAFADVSFRSTVFSEAASFHHATFSDAADFRNATFCDEANFSMATFSAAVNFDAAAFRTKAYFVHVSFRAQADFGSTTFSAAAFFLSATFTANANFLSPTFSAAAYFEKATFSARAYFGLATFSSQAYFSSVIFSAAAYFRDATFSAEADFSSATFRAESDFRSATFADGVRFAGAEKHQVFTGTSRLDLQFARIEKPDRVSFHSMSLRPHWFVNIDARKFDFANVKWGRLKIDEEISCLQKNDVSSPHPLLAIACRSLAVNAEENQRYEEASKFRYMAMEARRLESWRGFAPWRLSWWYWLASGYGERVWQAFFVLLGILLLSALLYNHVGFARWEPRLATEADMVTAKRDEVGAPLKFSRALTYSAAVMTFQKPEPRPATTAAQTIVLFETILGPVQAALLALAIRRKFMR